MRHTFPAPLRGTSGCAACPPENANCCEFVTAPPVDVHTASVSRPARGERTRRTAVSAATAGEEEDLVACGAARVEVQARVRLRARRRCGVSVGVGGGEKGEGRTRVLTMFAWPGVSWCLPAVITSHCWFAEPSQSASVTGVRFSRKSPESGSTERHFPLEVWLRVRVRVRRRAMCSAAHLDRGRSQCARGGIVARLCLEGGGDVQGRAALEGERVRDGDGGEDRGNGEGTHRELSKELEEFAVKTESFRTID